jgi:hypothetical protein
MIVTNYIDQEIKSRLNSENACCHSFQNLFCLPAFYPKIPTYRQKTRTDQSGAIRGDFIASDVDRKLLPLQLIPTVFLAIWNDLRYTTVFIYTIQIMKCAEHSFHKLRFHA